MPELLTLVNNQHESMQEAPAWLRERQEAGQHAWQASSWPTRKTEDWKYTSLHALDREFTVATRSEANREQLGLNVPALGGTMLVFVDGFFREDLSNLVQSEGLELVRFRDASDEQADIIRSRLGSVVDQDHHLFSNLNDANLADGVFLRLAANQRVEQPVQLIWHTTSKDQAFAVNQRLLVMLEANSELSLAEHFSGQGLAFTNGISELILEEGARLTHYRLQMEREDAMHIGGVHIQLGRNSVVDGFHLALGSALKRLDLVINHRGEGAECKLNGIYLLRNQEHADYHTCIEHAVPHCTTDENFRGIIGGKARAVFNGRIHIHPNAQKTRAELSNRNLLTSMGAEVNTKPELEIYADDVVCAHGATVAQLDPGMLHYLRTRGIGADEAQVLLSYGFINTLVDDLRLAELRDYLKTFLAEYFSAEYEDQARLVRHLK